MKGHVVKGHVGHRGLCGLVACTEQHEREQAAARDTRPRYDYLLPDGTTVPTIHDHGEKPQMEIGFELAGNGDGKRRVVKARLKARLVKGVMVYPHLDDRGKLAWVSVPE